MRYHDCPRHYYTAFAAFVNRDIRTVQAARKPDADQAPQFPATLQPAAPDGQGSSHQV